MRLMKLALTWFILALATAGCGAGAHGAVTFARAHDDLDPTGLKLKVKSAEVEGRADGSVVLRGTPILVFSKTEARIPADNPTGPGVLLFSVSGDQVEGNGKRGKFNEDDDELTFDGLTIAIHDNVPTLLISGYRIPTKMTFEAIPRRGKRAALLLSLFILAASQILDQRDKAR